MNKTFRIVFNKIRGAMMVVSEATRATQKKGIKCAVAVVALSTMLYGEEACAVTYSNQETHTNFDGILGHDEIKVLEGWHHIDSPIRSGSILSGSSLSIQNLTLSGNQSRYDADGLETISLGNVSVVPEQNKSIDPAEIAVSDTNSLAVKSLSLDGRASFTATNNIKQAEIGTITTADGESATSHASITLTDSDGNSSKITGDVVLGQYTTFTGTNTVVDNANVTVGAGATFSAVSDKDAFNINKLTVRTYNDESAGTTVAGSFGVNDKISTSIHNSVNIGEIVAENGTAGNHANIAINTIPDSVSTSSLSTSKIGTINLGDYAVFKGKFIQFSGDGGLAVDVTVGEHAQAEIYNYYLTSSANLHNDASESNINKLEVGTAGSFTATANVKVASIESSGSISLTDTVFSSQIGHVVLHDGGKLTVKQAKLGTSKDASGNVSGKVDITLDAGSSFTITNLLNTPEVRTLTIGVNEAKDKVATHNLSTATFKSIDKIVTGDGLNDGTHKYVSLDVSKTETLGALVLGDYTELTANAKTVSTTDTDGIQLGSHVKLALTAKDASLPVETGSTISTPKLALSKFASFTAKGFDTISLGNVSTEAQDEGMYLDWSIIEVSNSNYLTAGDLSLGNKTLIEAFTGIKRFEIDSIKTEGRAFVNFCAADDTSRVGAIDLAEGSILILQVGHIAGKDNSAVAVSLNNTAKLRMEPMFGKVGQTSQISELNLSVASGNDMVTTFNAENCVVNVSKIVTSRTETDKGKANIIFGNSDAISEVGALNLCEGTTINLTNVTHVSTDIGDVIGKDVSVSLTGDGTDNTTVNLKQIVLNGDGASFTADKFKNVTLGDVKAASEVTSASVAVSNTEKLTAGDVNLGNNSSFTAKSGVAQFVIDSISCTIGGSADKHAVIEVADADEDETTLSRVGTIDLADYAELNVEKAYIAGEDDRAVAVSLKKGAAVNLKNATATSKIGTLSLGDFSEFNATAATINLNKISGAGTFQLEGSKAILDGQGAIATLGTLNLDTSSEFITKNVTLEVGEIKGTGSVSVGTTTGGASSCTYANVHVKTLSMNGGSIYVDPAYGEVSLLTIDSFGTSNTLNTNITAGPNALVTIGMGSGEAALAAVNSNIENKGSINAYTGSTGGVIGSSVPMIYVARSLTLGTTGSLTADPTATVATGTPQSVSARNGGVIVIDQEKVGVHTAVFSGANSITVADSADGTATSAIAVINIVDGTTMVSLTDVANPEVLGNNFQVYTDNPYVVATLERETGTIYLTERATDDGLKVIASMGAQAMANRIDTVLSRTVSDRFAMPRDLPKGKDLWASISGEHFEQDNIGAGGAFKANMGYGAFGLDVYPTKNIFLGVAFQYSHGTIKGNSYSVKNKLKAYSGALYAGYTFETTGIEALGELAYTLGKNDVSTSYYDGLKQKFDTKTYSAGLTVQRKFDVGAFDITPSVGVRISKIKTDEIKEGLIESDKQSQTLVAVPLAVRFTAKPIETESGWLVSPKFKFSVTPTFGDKKIEVFGSKCTVIDTNPVQGAFGIGFTKGNFSTDIEANFGTGRQGTTSIGGKIGVNYSF